MEGERRLERRICAGLTVDYIYHIGHIFTRRSLPARQVSAGRGVGGNHIGHIIKIFIMEFLREMFQFLKSRKKWWLAPIIVVLLLLGVLLVIGGGSAIAPFIYTLF